MQGKNKADYKTIRKERMTEEEAEINDLVAKEVEVSREIRSLEDLMHAEVKVMHLAADNKAAEYMVRIKELRELRNKRRARIMDFWDRRCPGTNTLVFPAALVCRRNFRQLTVHDKIALVNALDRAGRLDLVDYTFKENVVARLVAEGQLPGLDDGAVKVTDNIELQINPKKGKKHGD